MTRILTLLTAFLIASPVFGLELTTDALVGKWNFTHMLLDGETNRQVNLAMEFLPNGEIVNFDKAGSEMSRASYAISDGLIVYTDKRGKQRWKIMKFDGKSLHVNHMGAEMFFKKTS